MSSDHFLIIFVYSATEGSSVNAEITVWLSSVVPGITFTHNLRGNNHIGFSLHFLEIFVFHCFTSVSQSMQNAYVYSCFILRDSTSVNWSKHKPRVKRDDMQAHKTDFGYFKLIIRQTKDTILGYTKQGFLHCHVNSNSYSIAF